MADTTASASAPTTDPESKAKKLRGRRKRRARLENRRPTRYAVIYDVAGPRARLGFIWFLLVAGALFFGVEAVGGLYGLTAGLAGYQSARAWQARGAFPNAVASGLLGAAIPLGATLGPAGAGVAVLAGIPVALMGTATSLHASRRIVAAAGLSVRCGLFAGLAGASVVLAYRVDLSAAGALVLLVSVYEMGDFLVGSGASNSFEGPIAGISAIAVFTFALWVARLQPFQGDALLAFGGLAAALAPLGQLAASAVLPRADARAPALRRLDSLIILGPAWVVLLWSHLEIL